MSGDWIDTELSRSVSVRLEGVECTHPRMVRVRLLAADDERVLAEAWGETNPTGTLPAVSLPPGAPRFVRAEVTLIDLDEWRCTFGAGTN